MVSRVISLEKVNLCATYCINFRLVQYILLKKKHLTQLSCWISNLQFFLNLTLIQAILSQKCVPDPRNFPLNSSELNHLPISSSDINMLQMHTTVGDIQHHIIHLTRSSKQHKFSMAQGIYN